ncbi:MAG TPA: hypothetical protein VF045_05660, partial [Acidimicrobiales bacterium]
KAAKKAAVEKAVTKKTAKAAKAAKAAPAARPAKATAAEADEPKLGGLLGRRLSPPAAPAKKSARKTRG